MKHLPSPTDTATIWSTWVQPVEWLEAVRERRFRDEIKALLWPALGLKKGATAVDVGCGGGALSRALARWLGPGAKVYGTDRDLNFLEYAKRRARQEHLGRRTEYLAGDALALPLPDSCADLVTSYTVIEHIADTRRFLQEQLRICKPGGRLSVMQVLSGGPGLSPAPKLAAPPTELENQLWEPLSLAYKAVVDDPWGVGKTDIKQAEILTLFEQLGLSEIMLDSFADVNSLEDARADKAFALAYLKMKEHWALQAADRCAGLLDCELPPEYLPELRRLIKARFAKERRWLNAGRKTWGFTISVSFVICGKVPEK